MSVGTTPFSDVKQVYDIAGALTDPFTPMTIAAFMACPGTENDTSKICDALAVTDALFDCTSTWSFEASNVLTSDSV